MDVEALLAGLTEAQRAAVTCPTNPLCILAGAGSGKTRVLTRRIAHRCVTGDAEPGRVLAVTFTRKAAGELSARLGRLGLRELPAAGTFHAHALAQLRIRWAGADVRPPALLEHKTQFVARLLGRTRAISPRGLAIEIEWAKARLVDPPDYPRAAAREGRRTRLDPEQIAALFAGYEKEKDQRRVVDFDDLLANCADALEGDRAFAEAQRWRFRHLFVDEFQDVNPLQHRLLLAWLGDRTDLCVVGDPHQAVYRWNGADASFLRRFAERFPGAEVVSLEDNFRSSAQILTVAGSVLGAGAAGAVRLRSHEPDGPAPEVVAYATDVDEANGIARALRDHHGLTAPWSDQAVLVRTNAQTALIEEALHRARIPYRIRGDRGLLDDPFVGEVLRSLRTSDGSVSSLLVDLEAALRAAEAGEAPDPTLLPAAPPPDQVAALAALVRLGRQFAAVDPTAPASALRDWIAAGPRADAPATGGDAVEVASFHAAKGLEWPVVHVAGLEDGFVPVSHARTPEAEAEERRLLYVATTRARRVLRMSWAAQRTFPGAARLVTRSPSPYLEAVVATIRMVRDADAPAPPPAGIAAVRERLERPAGSSALLAALRSWRARAARAAAVPDSVVLADRTLAAVAEQRPRRRADLERLPGVGPVKLAAHGDALLALVAEHSEPEGAACGSS